MEITLGHKYRWHATTKYHWHATTKVVKVNNKIKMCKDTYTCLKFKILIIIYVSAFSKYQ